MPGHALLYQAVLWYVFWDPLEPPKEPQEGPQRGPRMLQEGTPRRSWRGGSWVVPRLSNTSMVCFCTLQMQQLSICWVAQPLRPLFKCAKYPRGLVLGEDPRTTSEGLRWAKRALGRPCRTPISSQKTPNGPRRPPRSPLEAPRKSPGGPRMTPRGSQETEIDQQLFVVSIDLLFHLFVPDGLLRPQDGA